MLLQEIRQLRIQLVKTIENNNALRQKLEEQLTHTPAQSTTRVLVHHVGAPQGDISKTGENDILQESLANILEFYKNHDCSPRKALKWTFH